MDSHETHEIQADRRRGRGASTNRTGRFEGCERVRVHDGWDIEEDLPKLRTEVREETPRSVINYVRSPDLPFDRTLNPYRGCEHGCIYCFARPTHAYLGLSPGLDFETRLVARPDAPAVLAAELRKPGYKVAPLAIGTNTDPYQPLEKARGIMRGCLEVLSAFNHPVAIVTKGTLIERDLDILAPMAAKGLVRVGISVTTLDDGLSRAMEPRVPLPRRRLKVIRHLTEAGVPVRIMTSPIIPMLNDHEIEALLKAGKAAGADAASWIMLRLPLEVSQLFREWLHEHRPDRAERIMARVREMHGGADYAARWGHRMRGEGHYARMIADRFAVAARRLGLDAPQPPLRCDLFRPPPKAGDQLSLF
ncbi:PA0069 family radical SAM protein [Thalassobius vesicularis]|uniref:PA0069 family radical SAM protein n=1 Tax=Thalassobius vesicularis TaxID=1294297 RepID=A0A4S3M9G8_9RHOB|nr:PA0069 family radical SAM protein [Thalassobius vesicularis]THD73505.1 PA0069 family radical SAM protein [Thalassobius vesicularis]